jgi:protein O-GlcNAc transferase
VFAGRVSLPDHLARLQLADLFLDTLPYNAHATASDALWVGLPVLTCASGAMPGRVGASLLTAMGLPELITATLEDYQAAAIHLVTHPDRLRALRTRLQAERHSRPLFDSVRFCRHLETAYAHVWDLWQRGEPPRSFDIEPA